VLTRAHELKPDDVTVRRLLAEELTISADQHARRQDWRQAAASLEKAAALQPDSRQISEKLAQARARLASDH
jgi:cytochrome c-type biogenesis protein CcmH/NrfG